MFRVVIPARFGSTRLPGKLLELVGPEGSRKPVLQWVYEAGIASGAAEVIVATDDDRILVAAREFGADARMTSLTHPSGTDRIAEIALGAGWDDDDIVVNLQGDEPLMPPQLVGQVAELLERHPGAAIATLATRITSVAELLDLDIVKVVTDQGGRALYFSRAPIPWGRDTSRASLATQRSFAGARRHVGLYAYRVSALRRLSLLQPTQLEQIERLEQLRALENGLEIRVGDALVLPGPHVDTPEDLVLVNMAMSRAEAQPT